MEEVEWRNFEAICPSCSQPVRYRYQIKFCDKCSDFICPNCARELDGLNLCDPCFQKLTSPHNIFRQRESPTAKIRYWRYGMGYFEEE